MAIKKNDTIRNEQYIRAFGEHLRALRVKKGLTCEQLGENCGIDANQIARVERGVRSPTISTIYALAKGLEIPPFKLFQFDFKE